MKHKILICDDEEGIVSFLKKELEHEGYAVEAAYDGAAALTLLAENTYSAVLLDIMLPAKNGMEVLREIRKNTTLPVLMLTARKDVFDKVALLDAGADDYVTKPFDTLELLARLRRAIHRNDEVNRQALTLDEGGFRVLISGVDVALTKTEYDIFAYLHHHMGTVRTREQILMAVYGEYFGDSNNVDVNIKNIRKKISACGGGAGIIETVRGRGYVMRSQP